MTAEKEPEPRFEDVPQAVGCGTETILLVEDDPHVRHLAREILIHQGYEVWEAASPRQALESVREKPHIVRLLLTDLMMPSMNGCDLAREVSQLQPGIGVLFMSGYTDPDLARRTEVHPETALLEKPFTAATLLDSVRRALHN